MGHVRWSLGCALGICGLVVFGLYTAMAADVAGPVFFDAGPNAAQYGVAQGYPVGNAGDGVGLETLYIVGRYSHFDQLFPARLVVHAPTPWPFRRAPAEPEIVYSFGGEHYTIADYLHRNPVTGLLIAKDDTIIYEHYQYARTDRDRFPKTITAMLIGIAVSEGAIKSIDDQVATYVRELAQTEYGKTPIRALLHMSSGVAFSETYDGETTLPSSPAISSGRPGKRPSRASRNSTRGARRQGRSGTTPASRPRSSGWCCAPPPASRSPSISATRSGCRSAPRPMPPGQSMAPAGGDVLLRQRSAAGLRPVRSAARS